MDGMSGRKGVEPLSGQRDPMQMPEHGQAVRTLLIEHLLEHVREGRGYYGGKQYMIACAAYRYIAGSRVEPPAEREGAKNMFVGTPR
jgi:hypothetical protein